MNDIKIINDNIQTVIANKGTLGVASLRERDPALHILDEYAHFPITNPNNYAKIGFPKNNTNRDYSKEYLTYEITSNGELYLYEYFEGTYSGFDISYSLNGGEWTAMPKQTYTYDENDDDDVLVSSDTPVSISSGDIIKFKGNSPSYSSDDDYVEVKIMVSSYFNVYGNIMSIIYGDNFVDQISFPNGTAYNFRSFFSELSVIDASNLILPATVLTEICYSNMFSSCTSLVNAPVLPAITLARGCYDSMFNYCTSLTSAPELPATTLASTCYMNMFNHCTSLTQAPVLPATTLAEGCYSGIFGNCTSIAQAPELPAETLAKNCYENMFHGCTSLTTAPVLHATTLAEGCYRAMFGNCASLTQAPELPAETLVRLCYGSMFSNCTSLTSAPELPAETLAENCYSSMFYGCTNLNYIKCLATNISASYSHTNWVSGVQTTSGTFVKAASMSSWTSGNDGIPANWTVQDA